MNGTPASIPSPQQNREAAPAVVLLSGGLDSTTVLAIARDEGFRPHALSFSYGQRHTHELDRAREIAASAAVEHRVVEIDLRAFGGSALTDDSLEVPKHQDPNNAEIDAQEIPITYVPARNTIFLSFAMAWAEVLGARVVYIGVNALDYSGYPDCRPEYIEAFTAMARLATRAGVEHPEENGAGAFEIRTPLIDSTKGEIIARGLALGVDYARTLSCYDPVEQADGSIAACGACDACVLRLRGFSENGLSDPAPYVQIQPEAP